MSWMMWASKAPEVFVEGRRRPKTEQVKNVDQAVVKRIARMTDMNDHNNARKTIAQKILNDKELAAAYDGLMKIHLAFGSMPRSAMDLRFAMDDQLLYPQLERQLDEVDLAAVNAAL